ncbi:MAG: 4-hydroxybenzoate octaprenyltransferase [Nitrospirae bacterium]|nr:4-hydroxybenzoate octaprenyltransferase [Candidatus Manganitrophaceae bacterium]
MKNLWQKRKEISNLIRLDKQYGTLLLLFPTLWSLFVASEGKPTPLHLVIFVFGSFMMRSAGCVMNDMADRKFDAQVERTKDRPLARNGLTLVEAMTVLFVLLALSFFLVLLLNPLTILLSFAALLTAALYPFAKRYTYLPQIVLGVAFSWGVILAWTAVRNELAATPFLILLANLFWATGYDTVYALMDRDDDLRIGVKSTAVLFGARSWIAIGIFYALVILFLSLAGRTLRMEPVYYIALTGAALLFSTQAVLLRGAPSRAALFTIFRSHVWIGLIILAGIVLNYHFRSSLNKGG